MAATALMLSMPAAASAQPQAPEKQTERSGRPQRESEREQPAGSRDPFDEPRISRVAGPTRQELTFSGSVLGGYDDNLTAGLGTGSGTSPTAMASGTTGYLDGALDFSRTNSRRSLNVNAMGTLQGYPGYLDDPAAGGVATVDGMTKAGHTMTFRASERVGYEPFFNVFSQGASTAPLPPGAGAADPVTGLYERRSWNSNTSLGMDRRWGRSDSTSLSYSYQLQDFVDDGSTSAGSPGAPYTAYGDTSSHNVTADYRHRLANGVRARANYRYSNRDYTDSQGLPLPSVQNRVEAGPDFDKTLSRRRNIKLSVSAGAAYVESLNSQTRQPYEQWVPTGTFSTTFAFSPTSSLEAGYRRDFQELRGVTDNVYATDTAHLTVGGQIVSRTDVRFGATYSTWNTFVASGVNETLDVYGGSVRLSVLVSSKVSVTADYYYYHQAYSDPASLPAGFPADYDRHAVRVGMSFWLPVKGSTTRPPLGGR